jgi:hypothetical protein
MSAGIGASVVAGSTLDTIEPVGVAATTALAIGFVAAADHLPLHNLTTGQKATYGGLLLASVPVLEKAVHLSDGFANIVSNEYVRESIVHAPVHAITVGAAAGAIIGARKLINRYGLPRLKRSFTAATAALALAAGLQTVPEPPATPSGSKGFALTYIETAVQGRPAADREDVGTLLGPEVRNSLQRATIEGSTSLVYPLKRAMTFAEAQRVAIVQNDIFEKKQS